MKKTYIYLFLTLMLFSGVMYSMEHTTSDTEIEDKGFDLLSPELLEKIALYTTNTDSIEEAYNNVKNFLVALGQQGRSIWNDAVFIRYLVDTLYDQFIPTKESDPFSWSSWDNFDRAITIAELSNNNTYAIEKLKQWVKDSRMDEKFAIYAAIEIRRNSPLYNKKIIFLIENVGLNVNATTANGNSMLIHAVNANNKQIVQYLIDNGANMNIVNDQGKTARDRAQARGYTDIVAILDEAAGK